MKYLFFLIFLVHREANAQNPGPRLTGMGSGGTAITDIWSLQQNPAGIAELKRTMLAIAHEQHYFDPELSTQSAVFVVPYFRNVLGISFERFGFSEFRDQKIGIAYAKRFGDSFSMAIGLRYYQLSISRYGSAKALTIEVGFQLKVNNEFTIASHITNPNQSKYNNQQGSTLPVKLSLGGSFRFSDRLIMIADVRKVLKNQADGMTGIEYNIVKWFSLRGGVSMNPFKQYAGFGTNFNNMKLDVSVSSHPVLGYSPQFALGYEF
jgi:hypothetical protein